MSDKYLFWGVISLFTISLVMIFSLSLFASHFLYHTGEWHFFIRQLIAILLGIASMVYLSWLDPDKWFVKIGFAIFIFSFIAMLFMPVLPHSLVKTVLGAKRWIHIGPISIAPVEFFKIGFVFFLAWSFSRKIMGKGAMSFLSEVKIIFPYLVVLGMAIILIAIFQKDLGQVVVLSFTLLVMALLAGRSWKLFFSFTLLGITAFIILIATSAHRIKRVKSWWSTVQDNFLGILPHSLVEKLRVPEAQEPYQISNSLNAIHHGHMLGQGLGNGQFKLGYLSEVHTDFILSGMSEELGFLSLVLVSGLILFVVFRLLWIASRLKEPIYYLFTVGVALLIIFAFLVNSYGISGITPIKGIAVPFLSYGGSQIVAMSIGIGMVLMVSKTIKRRN